MPFFPFKSIATGVFMATLLTNLFPVLSYAQDFHFRVTLGPNQIGELFNKKLTPGDTVNLDLANPTNSTLTFQTTEQLGSQQSWTVAANSNVSVAFQYNKLSGQNVNYIVIDDSGDKVSQGVLIRLDGDSRLDDGDVIRTTLTLKPGKGEFESEELDAGDTLVFTLINPSQSPLIFSTLPEDKEAGQSWVIPGKSKRTVTYEYTNVDGETLDFTVK
ncbi:MAG: hypothetical protein KTR14_03660 [Vampirovibrio sp.]|nr:hypothetical protein [Vampirovibrio sp.]